MNGKQLQWVRVAVRFAVSLSVCLLSVFAWSQQISSVTVYQQMGSGADAQTFILEIHGTGLTPADDAPTVVVFPSNSPNANPKVLKEDNPDGTLLRAQFTASASYDLREIAVAYGKAPAASYSIKEATCKLGDKVSASWEFVPKDQVKNKYGNGVAKNFHVIQLSIVNQCPVSIIVPLAGITIAPNVPPTSDGDSRDTGLLKGGGIAEAPALGVTPGQLLVKSAVPDNKIVPYSLDHVTSVYSTDRKLTGSRAIFFNSLLAVATMGGAVEPFFGHGFTQGVSIWGGGFTNAAQTVFKDMSAEQLQNITSQSFGTAEQIGSNGSVSKFLFVPKKITTNKSKSKNSKKDNAEDESAKSKDNNDLREQALANGNLKLDFVIIPALTSATVSASK